MINKIMDNDINKIIRGRKFVYEILVLLLTKEPSEQTLRTLSKEEGLKDLGETFLGAKIIVESLITYNNSKVSDLFQYIRTEYQRLFVGPTPIQVPIWESVYFDKDGLLFGERTMEVRNFYNKYDLEFIHKNKEPEDHMAVELEFVLFLINKSLETKSEIERVELIKDQLRFLSEHLNTWNEKFADLILELSDNLFFQGVALLIKEFIAFDMATLNIIALDTDLYEDISIRSFVKWSKSLGISNIKFSGSQFIKARVGYAHDEEIIPTCSSFDCGGKCMVKAHVNDGVITKISTRSNEELNESNPMIKACARGINYRKYQYHPNRLKYPMKRVGKRGEGNFERISWEEAINIIVSETQRITQQYGPNSRYIHVGTGTTGGVMPSESLAGRLFSLTGGYLSYYHSVSMGNTVAATSYTYGTSNTGNSLDSLADTKLVVLWGHNPSVTIFGNTNYYFRKMKEKGCKFIVVDPRYSDTAVTFGDQWIPLLPTTDNALMDAMSYVIIKEELHDKQFVDKFCLGFDEENMPLGVPANESVVSYLFGNKDGIAKTPEWAESICKVPADTIRKLAREYATTKPAALIQGWGPQRHSCGERTARGATILASITGNIGIIGGWASGYGGITRKSPMSFPKLDNPYKGSISVMSWLDAITDAKDIKAEDGLKGVTQLGQNIKLIYNLAGNHLASQTTDINKAIKVLEDDSMVEFILVSDHFFTPSARYADILLPDTTFFERDDLGTPWGSGDYFMLSQKVVENYYESRCEYDWLSQVAERMGVGKEYTLGRTRNDWIRNLLQETKKTYPETPSYDDLQEDMFYGWKYSQPRIAFKDQIEDPKNNPFETPSGKIELFSRRLYNMNNPEIPGIPKYVSAWEGPEDDLVAKYPLQLIGFKVRNLANSTFYGAYWLREARREEIWISPEDADKRNIKLGDKIKVFNDRGATVVNAKVTSRIIPGVIALPTGAWYSPDKDGVDQNGCINVLTTFRKTALAHGNAHHTILVDINKI